MRRDPNARTPTTVNFLPEWYRQRRRGRRILRVQVLLLIGLVALFALLIGRELGERGGLSRRRVLMQQRLDSMRQRTEDIEQLRSTHRELVSSLRGHNRLHRPVGYAEIAAALVDLVPDPVSLRQIRMESGTRTVRVPTDGSGPEGEGGDDGEGSAPEQRSRPIVLIQVAGIGPADRDVSRFTGALSSHPLFGDVEIGYWRQATFQGLHVRRFAIRTTVRLDRRYEPPEAKPRNEPEPQARRRGPEQAAEVTDAR